MLTPEMLEEFAKDLSFESDDPAELSDFLRENAVYYRPYWPAVSTIQTDREFWDGTEIICLIFLNL